MKLSTILFGTLAAFATASAIHDAQANPQVEGLEGIQGIIVALSNFPGLHCLNKIMKSLGRDKTWKVDYSDEDNGNIKFTKVGEETCDLGKKCFEKNGDKWAKWANATFDEPCHGGLIYDMEKKNIEKLRKFIGEGN